MPNLDDFNASGIWKTCSSHQRNAGSSDFNTSQKASFSALVSVGIGITNDDERRRMILSETSSESGGKISNLSGPALELIDNRHPGQRFTISRRLPWQG